MHKATEQRKRVQLAGICVEVGSEDELSDSITIDIEDVGQVIIPIEYSWLPDFCSLCHSFGHIDKTCVGLKQVWRPKQKDCVQEAAKATAAPATMQEETKRTTVAPAIVQETKTTPAPNNVQEATKDAATKNFVQQEHVTPSANDVSTNIHSSKAQEVPPSVGVCEDKISCSFKGNYTPIATANSG